MNENLSENHPWRVKNQIPLDRNLTNQEFNKFLKEISEEENQIVIQIGDFVMESEILKNFLNGKNMSDLIIEPFFYLLSQRSQRENYPPIISMDCFFYEDLSTQGYDEVKARVYCTSPIKEPPIFLIPFHPNPEDWALAIIHFPLQTMFLYDPFHNNHKEVAKNLLEWFQKEYQQKKETIFDFKVSPNFNYKNVKKIVKPETSEDTGLFCCMFAYYITHPNIPFDYKLNDVQDFRVELLKMFMNNRVDPVGTKQEEIEEQIQTISNEEKQSTEHSFLQVLYYQNTRFCKIINYLNYLLAENELSSSLEECMELKEYLSRFLQSIINAIVDEVDVQSVDGFDWETAVSNYEALEDLISVIEMGMKSNVIKSDEYSEEMESLVSSACTIRSQILGVVMQFFEEFHPSELLSSIQSSQKEFDETLELLEQKLSPTIFKYDEFENQVQLLGDFSRALDISFIKSQFIELLKYKQYSLQINALMDKLLGLKDFEYLQNVLQERQSILDKFEQFINNTQNHMQISTEIQQIFELQNFENAQDVSLQIQERDELAKAISVDSKILRNGISNLVSEISNLYPKDENSLSKTNFENFQTDSDQFVSFVSSLKNINQIAQNLEKVFAENSQSISALLEQGLRSIIEANQPLQILENNNFFQFIDNDLIFLTDQDPQKEYKLSEISEQFESVFSQCSDYKSRITTSEFFYHILPDLDKKLQFLKEFDFKISFHFLKKKAIEKIIDKEQKIYPEITKLSQDLIQAQISARDLMDKYPMDEKALKSIHQLKSDHQSWKRIFETLQREKLFLYNSNFPELLYSNIKSSNTDLSQFPLDFRFVSRSIEEDYIKINTNFFQLKETKNTPKCMLIKAEYPLEYIRLLLKINHPLISPIQSYFYSKSENAYYLQLPYYPNGNVSELLKRGINRAQFILILQEILIALDHLHSQSLINNQINLDQIFVDQNGFAIVSPPAPEPDFSRSIDFIAPELVKSYKNGEKYISSKESDLYSVGVLMKKAISFISELSEDKQFISISEKLIDSSPEKRPSANDLLNDRLLNQNLFEDYDPITREPKYKLLPIDQSLFNILNKIPHEGINSISQTISKTPQIISVQEIKNPILESQFSSIKTKIYNSIQRKNKTPNDFEKYLYFDKIFLNNEQDCDRICKFGFSSCDFISGVFGKGLYFQSNENNEVGSFLDQKVEQEKKIIFENKENIEEKSFVLFLCRVFSGSVFQTKNTLLSLSEPPQKDGIEFHSVLGQKGSSKRHVIFNPLFVFPVFKIIIKF
ncbi:deneddylase 1 isoform c-related [Anaeramoeba ignava]|uniref:non-specific serine/threonine protein kinase n=1 Tax=Anaeramoeba ignava TaxID=1746090 RepID=A0A9Q0RET1_ANAIG|nr:deneddylase 1 isoform c-related [Anaeramoeba ignava]|eukprot:Anaeramoba_ignava/a89788_51.p1 GENE.a89788_51~~a89788_51.p1  ORF type:complete len:1272 (+),score=427.47 a89788_51:71-3886(+)